MADVKLVIHAILGWTDNAMSHSSSVNGRGMQKGTSIVEYASGAPVRLLATRGKE